MNRLSEIKARIDSHLRLAERAFEASDNERARAWAATYLDDVSGLVERDERREKLLDEAVGLLRGWVMTAAIEAYTRGEGSVTGQDAAKTAAFLSEMDDEGAGEDGR